MDYYGLLFLYYLKGLSGKSFLRLFFNIEAGGTEQLLPENTSTPTATPILADIQYPDGLKTDQYFTYRETPTTVSNKARIKTIKGNTLVWNQLVGTNVNGLSTIQGTTFSLNSNGSIHVTGTGTGNHFCEWRTYENPSFVMVKGHKYLATFKGLTNGIIAQVSVYTTASTYLLNKIDLVGSYAEIVTPTQDGITSSLIRFYTTSTFSGTTDIIMQLFDLTQMGLDITDPSDFTSLFPLSYYSYNQGSLLSFNGNGIKTVGKNLLSFPYASGSTSTITVNNDGSLSINKTASGDIYFNLYTADNGLKLPSGDYIIKSHNALPSNVGIYCVVRLNGTTITNISLDRNNLQRTINIPNGAIFICYMQLASAFIGQTEIKLTMSVEDMDAFEPYTSSTLSLPISTYFPTGMKSVDTVYDELTPRKAITRIGALNIDSSTTIATWESNDGWTANIELNGYKPNGAIKSDKFEYIGSFNGASSFATSAKAKGGYCLGIWENSNRVYFYSSSATTANDLINAIRGTNLYYELATPTETPITTEDANEALSLLMGKSVSSSNAKQMIDIITKGE